MGRLNRKATMAYYRTLYSKYGVDDAYLQNRAQRRVTGAFLERIELQRLRPDDKLNKGLHRRFKQVFRRTSFFTIIAGAITISAMLTALQATPAVANVVGGEHRSVISSVFKKGYQPVLNDDEVVKVSDSDSAVPDEEISPHLSLHLVSNRPLSSKYLPAAENTIRYDEDSDLPMSHDLRELTVIDTSVEGWEELSQSINGGEVLLLQQGERALTAIIEKLETVGQVDIVNLITHGTSGQLYFDGHAISKEVLRKNRQQWQQLGSYLAQDGDILLYGCNIASGERGREFIEELALITQADVAASIDVTGHRSLHGNWELERKQGRVIASNVLTERLIKNFHGLLGPSPGTITFNSGIQSHTQNAWTYQGLTIQGKNYDGGYGQSAITNWCNLWTDIDSDGTAGSADKILYGGSMFGWYYTTPDPPAGVNIKSTDGAEFGLTAWEMTMAGWGNCIDSVGAYGHVIIKGYKDGTLVGTKNTGYLKKNVSPIIDFTSPDSGSFADIDEVRIIPDVAYNSGSGNAYGVYIDDIVITTAAGATDSDGDLIADTTITDATAIPSTATSAQDVFDFKFTDTGGGDGLDMTVNQIVLQLSGTASANFSKLRFNLTGCATQSAVAPSGSSATFSGLTINTPDGGSSSTCVVQAYWADNTGLTDNQTIMVSVNGDTNVTVDGSGTQMGTTSIVSSNSMATTVTATKLAFGTEPAGSVSGVALTTQPIVNAVDAVGNTDTDYTNNIVLSEDDPGTLSGTLTLAATSGVSTFSGIIYNATADQQGFELDATSGGLTGATSNTVTSNVVATKLIFSTEPSPTSVPSGILTSFTTVPIVSAVNAVNVVDTGYSTDITLSEENGAGSATFSGNVATPASGVSTFTGLAINYTASGGSSETFNLRASSGGLTTGDSTTLTGVVDSTPPTVTDGNISISGATGTGSVYKVGDSVNATWNNTTGGDNNNDINTVTVDFTEFGGGAAVSATNSSDNWSATYTITSGAIDATNRNVSVTATDFATNDTTTADSTNASVDNINPTVSDGNISISGATGTGGAFKVGDTVTATWNNTAGGDNNIDTISGVTVDFSAFGGGSAVAAGNSSNSWTATYTITSGAIDSSTLNVSVTATDNAGNSTTAADSTNATVDNQSPTVTDGNISISGATGTGGAFMVGDTVSATWNNTGGGDNNADTISAVTVDFSAFGGGAAVAASNSSGSWTATYTITEDGGGSIDATNRNVSITATDNASNSTTTADTTNATVDNDSPVLTDGNLSISGATGTGGAFKIGDTVTTTWNNTAGGDNNGDTISVVTVDFSAFGGGSAVAASNSSETWTATYTITSGAIDSSTLNISATATDNAGNTTTTADSTNATVDNQPPTVTDANISIIGASGTGGVFKVGDTVTAIWNNTGGGDNNGDSISSVAVNFSAFGGGTAVAASNSSDIWTATYTITEDGGGSIDATNRNVSVTASDNASNSTTTADSSNATVDNDSPIVTDGNLSISGGSGTGGAFTVGDTVTATWDNTAGGDNNSDTISSVVIDFSQFGGGSAVVASNSSDIWTATYAITENAGGGINVTNRNISAIATDNAGNSTTTADSSNATVDNVSPNAPSTPDMAAITDNGVSTTDNKTSDTTPIFQGTTEIGATVTLTSSTNGQIGSGVANGSGNWTITSSALNYGGHNITAVATDSAGNESTPSGALSILINHDPTFTGTPTITGTPKEEETLGLTDTGTADLDMGDSVTLSYQWLRNGSIITGAISDTYVLKKADRNSNITCELSGRDLNGGEVIFSTSGVDVFGGFPWLILMPTLSSPNKITPAP